MTDSLAFYTTCAQVIPVLLLTEGVRIASAVRTVRDFERIESAVADTGKNVDELRSIIDRGKQVVADHESLVEASGTEISESFQETLDDAKAMHREQEQQLEEVIQAQKSYEIWLKSEGPSTRKYERTIVPLNSVVIGTQLIALFVCLAVIAIPQIEGITTLTLVIGAIGLGAGGLAEQLLNPLVIKEPTGWADRFANWLLRWVPGLAPLGAFAIYIGYLLAR